MLLKSLFLPILLVKDTRLNREATCDDVFIKEKYYNLNVYEYV